jgi:hypothetical protein
MPTVTPQFCLLVVNSISKAYKKGYIDGKHFFPHWFSLIEVFIDEPDTLFNIFPLTFRKDNCLEHLRNLWQPIVHKAVHENRPADRQNPFSKSVLRGFVIHHALVLHYLSPRQILWSQKFLASNPEFVESLMFVHFFYNDPTRIPFLANLWERIMLCFNQYLFF